VAEMKDKLLTKKDLAELWQVTSRTIDNWCKNCIVQSVEGLPVIRFTEQHKLELEGVSLDRMSH
jgi:phage terminase Nu1 subunit (DNA packaging protein)